MQNNVNYVYVYIYIKRKEKKKCTPSSWDYYKLNLLPLPVNLKEQLLSFLQRKTEDACDRKKGQDC